MAKIKDDASTLPDKLPKWVGALIMMPVYLIGLYIVVNTPDSKQQGVTNILIVLAIFLYATKTNETNETKKPKETENESPVCKYRRTEDYTKGARGPHRRDGSMPWGDNEDI